VIARYPVFTTFAPKKIADIKTWWPTWKHPCCNSSLPLPGYGAESLPGGVDNTYFYGLIEFVSKIDKLVEDLHLDKVEETVQFQFINLNKHPSMTTAVFYNSADAPPGTVLDRPVVIPIVLPEILINWEFRAVPKEGWSGVSTFFIVAMVSVYGGFIVSSVTFLLMESKSLQIIEAREILKLRAQQVRECFLN